MLDSQAKWLRGLDHPERRVREVAFRILTDEKVRDPLVGKAARSAIDRFGWDEAFEYPSQIFDLPLDAESFEWFLGRLERPDEEPPDLIHRKQILFWLTSAEPALQSRWFERLQAALRRYLKLDADYAIPEAQLPRTAAEIWAEIEEACDRLREIDEFPRDTLRWMETLSEQLWAAPDARELARKFEDWFERDPESDDELDFWRVGIAVSMMGRLGSLEALPRLLALLEKDFDWYNEQVMKAFIAIGSLECARFLVDAYPDSSEIVRIFLLGALERLRFPEIEPELWKLCESESDDMNRVQLAHILALYGTPESIHRAAAIAEENIDDPERIDLLELLYARDVLAGNPPAGRQERWLRIFEEREAEALERMERFENLRRPLPLSAAAPETVFNDAPKIGRNDACPCGSGKKFKKCCGKKG